MQTLYHCNFNNMHAISLLLHHDWVTYWILWENIGYAIRSSRRRYKSVRQRSFRFFAIYSSNSKSRACERFLQPWFECIP